MRWRARATGPRAVRPRPLPVVAAALVAAMLAAACTSDPSGQGPVATGPEPGTGSGPSATGPAPEPDGPIAAKDFDPARFSDPTTIDNRWFPLIPGTRWVYRGSTLEDGDRIRHRVVFTVTDLTKEILGVTVLVAWDRDYTEGELVEAELAFFAQDDDGNVWHFGQYPEEYDNGRFDKAPAWIAGFEGARPGLTIKAEPDPDAPSYSQGFAPPPINWIDRARVYQVGEETCVPAGCYSDVLVTEEFERDKPGAFQLKFYAPDVGNVRVGWRGKNEKERETLVLVEWGRLGDVGLAEAREAALALEAKAYERSDVYAQTAPAVQLDEV